MPWAKGQTGNPKGRPRAGLAMAERVRERLDPDKVIDLALRLAEDETVPIVERYEALLKLADRGYVKPPTAIAAHVTSETTTPRDWTAVPLGERRALLDQIKRATLGSVLDVASVEVPPDPRPMEPRVHDDNRGAAQRLLTDRTTDDV